MFYSSEWYPTGISVLSPYLFCIYMRDISGTIAKSNLGCHIAGMPINMLLYADDLVLGLLALSWRAQQRLLSTCYFPHVSNVTLFPLSIVEDTSLTGKIVCALYLERKASSVH